MIRLPIFFISFLALIGIPRLTNSEASEKIEVFRKSNLAIYKRTPGGGETLLYKTQKHFVDFSVSPSGDYVAFVESTKGAFSRETGEFVTLPQNNLVICNTEGTVIRSSNDDVRKLAWSPDGRKLAYITGTYREEGYAFTTTGIYILTISDGSKKQITKDFLNSTDRAVKVGRGYDLDWATHDSNLYIQERRSHGGNYMYDAKSETTRRITHKGIHFSPDGRYYLAILPEDDNYLYESATDTDITAEVRRAIGRLPYGWIPDQSHHLLTGKTIYVSDAEADSIQSKKRARVRTGTRQVKEKKHLIYDVEKREIVEQWLEKP